MPDSTEFVKFLGLLVLAAPAMPIVILGVPSLLGDPLSERASDRACRLTVALGLSASVGVLV